VARVDGMVARVDGMVARKAGILAKEVRGKVLRKVARRSPAVRIAKERILKTIPKEDQKVPLRLRRYVAIGQATQVFYLEVKALMQQKVLRHAGTPLEPLLW